MISIVKLKKYVVNTGILDIILSKLYYKKKLCPIILFKFDKSLKKCFYYAILPLNLAIYMRIEGGK